MRSDRQTVDWCDDGWSDDPGAGRAAPGDRRKNTPPPPFRGGRGRRRFSFTYEDLALFFKVKVGTVRRWASSGRFDPRDPLGSVAQLLAGRRRRRA